MTTDFSWRGGDQGQPVTSTSGDEDKDNIRDKDSIKRSSVSWLMATTLRMCKADPTSCFRGRVGRSQRKTPSASHTPFGIQQRLILSSLLK